jgi:cystathionine beta-lyase/cystathionine gamma-synthase
MRVERSWQTTEKVITFLQNHPKVERIYYPFLPSHPQYALAKKQMRGGGGLFTVLFKSENNATMEAFINRLTAFLIAVSWGGHESLMMPTAGFYHWGGGRVNPPHPFNLVRFYIGLEDAEYLIQDLEQGMELL